MTWFEVPCANGSAQGSWMPITHSDNYPILLYLDPNLILRNIKAIESPHKSDFLLFLQLSSLAHSTTSLLFSLVCRTSSSAYPAIITNYIKSWAASRNPSPRSLGSRHPSSSPQLSPKLQAGASTVPFQLINTNPLHSRIFLKLENLQPSGSFKSRQPIPAPPLLPHKY